MAETELVEMQITESGYRCIAALQEVMAQFDLSGPDASARTNRSLPPRPRRIGEQSWIR